jgi:Glycosyltransferase family 87
MTGRRALLAIGVLCAAWVVTLLVGPWADERVSDLFVYRQAADAMLAGGLPYREVFFEYPPLAAGAIVLPAVVGSGEEEYRLAFAALGLGVAAAVVVLVGALAERSGGRPGRAMLAVAVSPLLFGALARTHLDLVPVALTLLALLLLCRGGAVGGMAVLGLAVMTKGFPLVVAPVALAWLWRRDGRKVALRGAGALALTLAVIGSAALAASPSGAIEAVEYHLERPVQLESVPASILLALDGVGLGAAESVSSHRSDGLSHPLGGVLEAGFALALLASVVLLTVAAARGGRPDERRLLLCSLAAMTAFAALGKVLSPQFLLWVMPLGALAIAWRLHRLAAAVTAALLLTFVEFPSRYFDLVDREPVPVALVAARNALLLLALGLVAAELRARRGGAAGRWPWRGRPGRPPRGPRSATGRPRLSRT